MAFRRQSNRSVRLTSTAPYSSNRKGSSGVRVKSCSVFCGNLSWDVTCETLSNYMSQVGVVVSCEIKMTRDGKSKGSGLVKYRDTGTAARAIAELDDTDLMGRLITVREDREKFTESNSLDKGGGAGPFSLQDRQIPQNIDSRRVYVGNLDYRVSWQDLKDHMRSAGDVVRAEVLIGADGRSKGYGLVEFASAADARNAIVSLHDTELNGRLMTVRQDRDDADKRLGGKQVVTHVTQSSARTTDRWVPPSIAASNGRGSDLSSARVYVGNLSYDVSWQDLKDHMRAAGDVLRANILTMPNGTRSKGCGIVEYSNVESAANAIATLTNTELKGRPIFVREDREEKKMFA